MTSITYAEGITPGWCSLQQSLGNVLRLVRPVVVIDEGHNAYSATARDTIEGFNPRFLLELSATPNVNGKHSSNVLVNVPGPALKDEAMIKLPINVVNEDKGGWKHTITLAHAKLDSFQKEADAYRAESNRNIRPIVLLRVERTGKDQRDSSFAHAEDAKEYLIEKLGVQPDEIRLKTSDVNDLGDEDLMLPEYRADDIPDVDAGFLEAADGGESFLSLRRGQVAASAQTKRLWLFCPDSPGLAPRRRTRYDPVIS